MKRLSVLSLFVILFFASCEKLNPDSGNRISNGSYEITISGDKVIKLIGKDVDTRWDEEDEWVYLGTDDHLEPIGTLTMQLSVPASSADPIIITDAIQSKTDVRVGTAAELNGRNYVIRELSEDFPIVTAEVRDWEIGANYLKGTLYIDMERVLNYSTDTAEFVTVTGTFTAVN